MIEEVNDGRGVSGVSLQQEGDAGQQPVHPHHHGGSSLRELCSLFCCPPWPSKIVSKLAFMPPQPSYNLVPNESGSEYSLELVDGRAEWPHGPEAWSRIHAFYTHSTRNNRIACIHIASGGAESKFTLVFSHGNAVDVGQMCSFYYALGAHLGCNVFSYDYSGYGRSTGQPSERNLYSDISAAWTALSTRYALPENKLVIYGQSIGTVPSIDLASRLTHCAALVLHSPLMSGVRVAFPNTQRTYCWDAFPSIDKIKEVSCPTLVIHGTEDDVIDFTHGLAIHEQCPSSVEPLWVEGAGHNDVELHGVYLARLYRFIDREAGNPRYRKDKDHNATTAQSTLNSQPNEATPIVTAQPVNETADRKSK